MVFSVVLNKPPEWGITYSDKLIMGPDDEHSMEVQLGQCRAHKAMCEDELELLKHGRQGDDCEMVAIAACGSGMMWVRAEEFERVKWELDAEIAELAWCNAQLEVLEWSVEECYEQCGEYDE